MLGGSGVKPGVGSGGLVGKEFGRLLEEIGQFGESKEINSARNFQGLFSGTS